MIAGVFAAAAAAFPQNCVRRSLGVAVSLGLLFFVTLSVEPIWIGWRAGQVLLVTCPGLVGAGSRRRLREVGPRRRPSCSLSARLRSIGLPTTVIDYYNAQDTSNVEMAAGFRWTVVVSPGEQARSAGLS